MEIVTEQTSIEAGFTYLETIREGDIERIWPLTGDEMQEWLVDRITVAKPWDRVAVLEPDPDWKKLSFPAALIVGELQRFIRDLDVDALSAGLETRIDVPEHEEVWFAVVGDNSRESGIPGVPQLTEDVVADLRLTLRIASNGWLVESITRQYK